MRKVETGLFVNLNSVDYPGRKPIVILEFPLPTNIPLVLETSQAECFQRLASMPSLWNIWHEFAIAGFNSYFNPDGVTLVIIDNGGSEHFKLSGPTSTRLEVTIDVSEIERNIGMHIDRGTPREQIFGIARTFASAGFQLSRMK